MRTPSVLIQCVLLALLPTPCLAQWLTQQVRLAPGWNAVFVEVQPEPRRCDKVFGHVPVQSVWKWDRRFSTFQFDLDPTRSLPESPDWLMWVPPTDTRAFLNTLFELQGNQAYLIKVASNAAPFTLPVKGQVIIPRLDWYPHSLNLVGFPINPRNPPTFGDFFRYTPEVDTSLGYANELYRLDAQGRGQRIVAPVRDRIQPGAAYWVGCARAPTNMSPIHVTPSGGGVNFGKLASSQELSIRNAHPTATLTVRLQQHSSESAPLTGGFPEVAGPVPLSWLSKDASNQWSWAIFPTNGLALSLAPQEQTTVHLGVRRLDFAPYTPQGTNGFAYASVLEITDGGESLLIRVPVKAEVADPLAGAMQGHSESEGLWVGQATVNQVNAPAYTANLLPTPAPASFRLLVHVDGNGQARLLQQVLLAWDSTQTASPHTNGTYVLYANQAALPNQATDVKRISSEAFPLMAPLAMTNIFTNTPTGGVALTNVLTTSVAVRFDDPVNPFLHRYHPRHDNKNWNFQPYTGAVETRTIQRDITLEIDPATYVSANPYWGVEAVRGIYRETVSGLRAQPIRVQGEFTLQRISRINTLRAISP